MDRIPIEGNPVVRTAGFDPDAGIAEVEFQSGVVYRFYYVTRDIWELAMSGYLFWLYSCPYVVVGKLN